MRRCTFVCTSTKERHLEKAMTTTREPQKQQVRDLLKAIETGESGPLAVIDPNKYVQHNLRVKDGLTGFREFLAQLPKGSVRVNTARVFQDGDMVFAHS